MAAGPTCGQSRSNPALRPATYCPPPIREYLSWTPTIDPPPRAGRPPEGSARETAPRGYRRHPRPRHPAALLATGSLNASGLSPQLADAPPGLVALASQADAATSIDPNVLLAIAKIETDWGRARQAQPDDLVPADIRASIDATALQPGGATAQLLGLQDGRRIGDWVNPQPVGAEHAMGFMQFLPSTWRAARPPPRPVRPATPTARSTR